MESIEVAVPPLPEQIAICGFLDREAAKIDALIAKKQRLIELLQENSTALINQVFTGGVDADTPKKSRPLPGVEADPSDLGKLRRNKSVFREIEFERFALRGRGTPYGVSSHGRHKAS